jgi:nucleotide-binding universal stress UspA family protein
MKTVMVGLDGSPASADAGRWAAWLAEAIDAQLVAATAWLPQQAEGTPEDIARRRSAAAEVLDREWCAPIRELGVEPRALLVDGSPEVLTDTARAADADVLVVGNRGGGGIAALHIGSVAHHLAHHLVQPLAIVPAPAAREHPGTIVVGIDGSPASAAAVRWCAALAAAVSARVVAVTAFEPLLATITDRDLDEDRQPIEHHLQRWIEPFRAAGVDVETRLLRDVHPVAAIADAAHGVAQLVVVGSHGLGGFSGMRLGGVAVQLVHHTELPVVVVPTAPVIGSPSTQEV